MFGEKTECASGYYKWGDLFSCHLLLLQQPNFSVGSPLFPGHAWTKPKVRWHVIIPWYPRIVPSADTRLCVKEVHLALHCCSLLCFKRTKQNINLCHATYWV